MTRSEYQYKTEKAITNWESLITTNLLLSDIAHHLAVIADRISEERESEG